MKWQGCKPPATSLSGASKGTLTTAVQMTYFFIDFWKASSAFFAFSSAIFSFSTAAFSLSSAAFMALSARTDVSSAFTLAASPLHWPHQLQSWRLAHPSTPGPLSHQSFSAPPALSRGHRLLRTPIIRVGRTSIIVIRNRLFFISLHLLSDPSFRSVFLAGKMDRIRSQYHPRIRKRGDGYPFLSGSITILSISRSIFRRFAAFFASLPSSNGPAITR